MSARRSFPHPADFLKAILALAMIVGTCPGVWAGDATWDAGAGTTAWSTNTNWDDTGDPVASPGAAGLADGTNDVATIDDLADDPVVDAAYSIGKVNGEGILTLTNNLRVNGDGTVDNIGFNADAPASTSLTLTTGTIQLGDGLTVRAETMVADLIFDGVTFTDNSTAAILEISDSSGTETVTFDGASNVAEIDINILDGQQLDVAGTGTLTIGKGAQATAVTSNHIIGTGTLNVLGVLNVADGTSVVVDNLTINSAALNAVTFGGGGVGTGTLEINALTFTEGTLAVSGAGDVLTVSDPGTINVADNGGTDQILDISGGGSASFAGNLAETVDGGLLFTGGSSSSLSVAGQLTVHTDALALGDGDTLAFGSLAATNNGTVTLGHANATAKVIGAGTLNATLDLTTSTNGTVQIGDHAGGDDVAVLDAGTSIFTDANILLTIDDSSSLTLSDSATTGAATINGDGAGSGGTLSVADDATATVASLTATDGTITAGTTATTELDVTGALTVNAGTMTTIDGSGTLDADSLSNAAATAHLTVDTAALDVNGAATFGGAGNGGLTFHAVNGGTAIFAGNVTEAGAGGLNVTAGSGYTLTVGGTLDTNGALAIGDGDTVSVADLATAGVAFSNTAGVLQLNGTSTYGAGLNGIIDTTTDGIVRVGDGTSANTVTTDAIDVAKIDSVMANATLDMVNGASHTGTLANAGNIDVSGAAASLGIVTNTGTIDLKGGAANLTIASSTTLGTITNTGGGGTLTFSNADNITHGGTIANDIKLVVTTGTLTLTGIETFESIDTSAGGIIATGGNNLTITGAAAPTTLTAGGITGTGSVILTNAGNITHIANSIDDNATLQIDGGTFTTAGAETVGGLTLATNTDFDVAGGADVAIANTLALGGTTDITGANAVTGTDIDVTDGTNNVASYTATGTLAVDGDGAGGADSATFTTLTMADNDLTIGGTNAVTVTADLAGTTTNTDVSVGTSSTWNLGGSESINSVTGTGIVATGGNDLTLAASSALGNITSTGGTVTLAAGGSIGTSADLTGTELALTGGTLDLGSATTATIATLNASNAAIIEGSGNVNGAINLTGTASLKPGNSIGTLNADSFAFTKDNTVFIEVGDADADKLVLNAGAGTINFNSTGGGQTNIEISVEGGSITADSYTYVIMDASAGGGFQNNGVAIATETGVAASNGQSITAQADSTALEGYTFTVASGDSDTLQLTGSVLDATAKTLTLEFDAVSGGGGSTPPSSWSPNETTVSDTVTTLANGGHAEAVTIRTALNALSGAAREDAANQLTPAAAISAPASSFASSQQFSVATGTRISSVQRGLALRDSGTAADRMLAMADPDTVLLGQSDSYNQCQLWFKTFGNWADQGAIAASGLRGFSTSTFGFAVGADELVSPELLLGVAAGGAWNSVSVRDTGNSSGNTDNFMLDLYASWFTPGEMYVNTTIGYQYSNYSFDRVIPALSETAQSSHHGNMFRTSLEIGRELCVNQCHATPFFGIDYITLREAGYTETGAATSNLAISANTTTAWLQSLGVRFSKRYYRHNGWVVEPELTTAWVHDYGDGQLLSVGRFAFDTGNSQPFSTTGYPSHRNRARLGAGLNVVFNCVVDGHVNYTAEFAKNFGSHTLEAGLNFKY